MIRSKLRGSVETRRHEPDAVRPSATSPCACPRSPARRARRRERRSAIRLGRCFSQSIAACIVVQGTGVAMVPLLCRVGDPFRQSVQFDHCAAKQVRSHLGARSNQRDRQRGVVLGGDLPEADRNGQTRWSGPHGQFVICDSSAADESQVRTGPRQGTIRNPRHKQRRRGWRAPRARRAPRRSAR